MEFDIRTCSFLHMGNQYVLFWLDLALDALQCNFFFVKVTFAIFLATRPKHFQPSSCIALVYQLLFCHTIADRLHYDWIAEKDPDG